MAKRINITLPEKTLNILEKAAPKRGRSRLISDAVQYYVKNRGSMVLKEQMKAGYEAGAQEDLKLATEWFPIEEEIWQTKATNKRKNQIR